MILNRRQKMVRRVICWLVGHNRRQVWIHNGRGKSSCDYCGKIWLYEVPDGGW